MQAGAVLGAMLSSPLADRKGRKPALFAVAVTGIIGGFMQAFFSGHLSVFYIGRSASSTFVLNLCNCCVRQS